MQILFLFRVHPKPAIVAFRVQRTLVDALAGYYASHAATGVIKVASPSWNEVDVTMKDRLTSIFTGIHAHIEGGNAGILLSDGRSFRVQQSVNSIELRLV